MLPTSSGRRSGQSEGSTDTAPQQVLSCSGGRGEGPPKPRQVGSRSGQGEVAVAPRQFFPRHGPIDE